VYQQFKKDFAIDEVKSYEITYIILEVAHID
jgi:hypothetical protein